MDDWHESALSLLPIPSFMETPLLSALPSLEPAGAGKPLEHLLKTYMDVLTRLTKIPDTSVFGPDRRLMSSEDFHEELDGIHPGFGDSGRGCAHTAVGTFRCHAEFWCHKGARPGLVWHQPGALSLLRCWAWPGWGGI